MYQLLTEMKKLQNEMSITQFMVGRYAKQFYVLFINTHRQQQVIKFHRDNNPYIPDSGYY